MKLVIAVSACRSVGELRGVCLCETGIWASGERPRVPTECCARDCYVVCVVVCETL